MLSCTEGIFLKLFYFQGDAVFMEPKSHQDEYVLSDVGKVYTGSYKQPIGRDWAFGQFEDSVLPAAVYLLDRSKLRPSERGNAVKVARAVSAMVNEVDDGGVLIGRWTPPYDDGVEPWQWTGNGVENTYFCLQRKEWVEVKSKL